MSESLQPYYRPLGSTGMMVSPLGLGTVKLGRDQGVKYPAAFEIPDDQAATRLLALARELGINLLDTAPAYGRSEERLGWLLKGQRQQWVIVGKVGEEFQDGKSLFDFSAAHTQFSVERSLKRLGTDYLDMVLVHSNGDDLAILQDTEVYPTLAALKQQGKIRAFGFSGKTLAGNLQALDQGDCAMVAYNLAYQEEAPVLDRALRDSKAILVKKAFNSGKACLAPGADPIAASLELVLGHAGVTSTIVGTINPGHLTHNVAVAVRLLKTTTTGQTTGPEHR